MARTKAQELEKRAKAKEMRAAAKAGKAKAKWKAKDIKGSVSVMKGSVSSVKGSVPVVKGSVPAGTERSIAPRQIVPVQPRDARNDGIVRIVPEPTIEPLPVLDRVAYRDEGLNERMVQSYYPRRWRRIFVDDVGADDPENFFVNEGRVDEGGFEGDENEIEHLFRELMDWFDKREEELTVRNWYDDFDFDGLDDSFFDPDEPFFDSSMYDSF